MMSIGKFQEMEEEMKAVRKEDKWQNEMRRERYANEDATAPFQHSAGNEQNECGSHPGAQSASHSSFAYWR